MLTRRHLLTTLGSLPLYGAAARALPGALPTLPDRASFPFAGIYLNAAYTHPLGLQGEAAAQAYLNSRVYDASRSWPGNNTRGPAVAAFAELIHAAPSEIAVVPSTMEGENLVGAAVGLGPQAGVVTDAYHYDASLAMYGELGRERRMPVAVVAPRNNRIRLEDFEPLLRSQPRPRLLAVSLVGSVTGFTHDLKALCGLAHEYGVLVYADIIQAAGAIPIDVKQSGVDFCCCGTYKWLMGDFGTAFLYVRPDRLPELNRVEFGWRQFGNENQHVYPFDLPGPPIGDWKLGTSTISHFEVSTPDWAALGVAAASIGYIQGLGLDTIQRHRQPLLAALQRELPRRGFLPLTPEDSTGPIVAFAYKGAQSKLAPALRQAGITITVAENRIRISPSVYNDMNDVDRLLSVLPR